MGCVSLGSVMFSDGGEEWIGMGCNGEWDSLG